MTKTRIPATYKPLLTKRLLKKSALWCGGMLGFNIAANVIVAGMLWNQPELAASNVHLFLECVGAIVFLIAVCAIAAWIITLPFTLLAGAPLFIIRDWKLMVLDNDADTATNEGTVAP
jgi:predicted tellurium resistance membrane protein TerC